MQVYLTNSSGQVTTLVATGGIESVLARAWGLEVVRPPESEAWIEVGLGNQLPQEVRVQVLVQATGGASAAQALDALSDAAEAAEHVYVEHNGDAVVARLVAYQGIGNVNPRGTYAYDAELRWIADRIDIAGPLTDDSGAYRLTADDGTSLILWEEEV